MYTTIVRDLRYIHYDIMSTLYWS